MCISNLNVKDIRIASTETLFQIPWNNMNALTFKLNYQATDYIKISIDLIKSCIISNCNVSDHRVNISIFFLFIVKFRVLITCRNYFHLLSYLRRMF